MMSKIEFTATALLLSLLVAPASARTDLGDGYNFPRFTNTCDQAPALRAPSCDLVNRPFYQR